MTLPGGVADKFGNLFEGQWAVRCVLDIIDDRTYYFQIDIEPLGQEGFEFSLYKTEEGKEFHQVKTGKQWTTKAFCNRAKLTNGEQGRSIWEHFCEQLKDPQNTCFFVCNNGFRELYELCDRANKAQSFAVFEQYYLNGEWGEHFTLLVETSQQERQTVYEQLKRLRIANSDIHGLQELLNSKVENLIECRGQSDILNIIDVLFMYIFTNAGRKLTAEDVWGHLARRGFTQKASRRVVETVLPVQIESQITERTGTAFLICPIRTTGTLNIQELIDKLKGKKNEHAKAELEKVVDAFGQLPDLQFLSAIVDYHQAFSTEIVPDYMLSLPEPLEWALLKQDNMSLDSLSRAAEGFRVLSLIPDIDEQKRVDLKVWYMAALANQPGQQEKAAIVCREIINDDSVNPHAIMWALSRGYDIEIEKSVTDLEALVLPILQAGNQDHD